MRLRMLLKIGSPANIRATSLRVSIMSWTTGTHRVEKTLSGIQCDARCKMAYSNVHNCCNFIHPSSMRDFLRNFYQKRR
ncbi:UNVERIFIED_CONTAM: hypothetical protein NCL1_13173 [Trichonephila clavipes]